jgi:hypothetical protein
MDVSYHSVLDAAGNREFLFYLGLIIKFSLLLEMEPWSLCLYNGWDKTVHSASLTNKGEGEWRGAIGSR